jgi:hypothetical protein
MDSGQIAVSSKDHGCATRPLRKSSRALISVRYKGGPHMETVDIRTKPRWTRGRLSVFLFGVIIPGGTALAVSAGATRAVAQSAEPTNAAARWNSVSSSSPALMVLGNIRQLVSEHVAGSPLGVHILIDGPLGSFDASLGSSLPHDVMQALSDGAPVQITGSVLSINGKDYLMARQLKVADHVVTIRNSNGFLVHNPSATGSSSAKSQSQGNGGVQ